MRIARIAGFFGILALASCDLFVGPSEKCPEIAGAYFNVFDISSENYRQTASCCAEPVPAYGQLPYSQHFIRLNYQASYYSQNNIAKDFSLFPSAMALSCLSNGELGSKESVNEIQIVTLYDIDPNHKKGTLVNELFDFEEMGGRIGLDQYLSQPDRKLRSQHVLLYLRDKPVLCDTVAFKIQVSLDNGEHYSCVSAPVKLD